jgi:hypothetical protein
MRQLLKFWIFIMSAAMLCSGCLTQSRDTKADSALNQPRKTEAANGPVEEYDEVQTGFSQEPRESQAT